MSNDRQQEGKDPLIPFVITLAGVTMLTLNPIAERFKIGIALLTAAPGVVFTLSEYHLYRDRRKGVERLSRQTREVENSNRQLNRALDARQAELTQKAEALDADRATVEQLRSDAQNEAARVKLEAELEVEARLAETARLEAAVKDDTERKRQEAERESDRIVEDARRAAADLIRSVESRQSNFKAEMSEARRRCAHAIKAARRRWRDLQHLRDEELKSAIKAELQQVELARKQIDLDRETMQQAIALERAQTADQIANDLKDFAKRKADAEKEIEDLWEEFEQEKVKAGEQFAQELEDENNEKVNAEIRAVNAQLKAKQAELNALIAQTNQELADKTTELEASWEQQYQQWLIGHVQEVNRLKEELEDWQARYLAAEEELAASKDIILPNNPFNEEHKSRAYIMLMWFKSKGVMLNYYNSSIDAEGKFTLFFKPWMGGSKGKKAIEAVFDGMLSDFGLAARPVVGETIEAWFIETVPSAGKRRTLEDEMRFFGMPYSTARIPSTDPRLEEPESLRDLDEDTRRAVMMQASAEERLEEMLRFRPGKLPKPVSFEITPLEIKTFEWLTQWRAAATRKDPDGAKGNLREINRLLTEAYGVSIGSSTETRDRNTGESLRDRVHRICKLLRLDLKTRSGDLN